MGLVAFYDANVLYPADLRNLLMHLALTGLFQAKWSPLVHQEWIESLLKKRPDFWREQLDRTRALMDKHASGALVTGFEHLISDLQLPDPNDRHVLAAAIHCEADVIVTMNLRDFPVEALFAHGIEAQHPDDFVLSAMEMSPSLVCEAVEAHRQSLRNPPKTVAQYLDTLERQGLRRSVWALRPLLADRETGHLG